MLSWDNKSSGVCSTVKATFWMWFKPKPFHQTINYNTSKASLFRHAKELAYFQCYTLE